MPSSDTPRRWRLTAHGAPLAAPDRRALSAQHICALAARFPSTAHFGEPPWRPEALDDWGVLLWQDLSESFDPVFAEEAEEDGLSSLPQIMVGLTTARFLLHLWDPDRTWRCGRVDLTQALLCIWDAPHRAAFLSWAQDPQCR